MSHKNLCEIPSVITH